MKHFFSGLALLFFAFTATANETDSLKNLLQANLHDTVKFTLRNQLFRQLIYQNTDSAFYFLSRQAPLLRRQDFMQAISPVSIIDYYNNLGIYYKTIGKTDSAIANYNKGYTLAQEAGEQSRAAIALNNIANIYYLKGDYNISLDYHLQSLGIRQQVADTMGMAMSYGNIAILNQAMKKYDEALAYYTLARDLFTTTTNQRAIAWTYRNMGSIYLDTKDYPKAISSLTKSTELCSRLHDISGLKYSLLNLAMVYLGKFETSAETAALDSANYYFDQLAAWQQNSFDKRIEINSLIYRARAKTYRTAFREAIALLDEAEALLQDSDMKNEMKELHEGKSAAYEGLQHYAKALQHYKTFKVLSDTLFNIEKAREIGQKQAEFAYAEKLKLARLEFDNAQQITRVKQQRQWLAMVVFILLFILSVILFYYFYRQKTRLTKQLQQEKESILQKYDSLEKAYNSILENLEHIQQQQEPRTPIEKPLPRWVSKLSKRELEVLSCIAIGMTDKEIEAKLFISVATVRTHCQRIYTKLLVRNRVEAVNLVRQYGLI